MNDDILINVLAICLLVLANAFFVAAEFALVRTRRTRIEALIADGSVAARAVKEAIDRLTHYISATQVGITLSSLALGAIGEPFVAGRVEALFQLTAYSAHGISLALALFFITFIHVVAGELIPKSLSLQFPERIAMYLVRPLRFFALLFSPFIWLLKGTSSTFLKLIGIKPIDVHSLALSEEELLLMLSESKKAGVVSEDEQKMLQRVFKFHDKTVREIMVPRPDVAALDLRANVDEIKRAFEQGYSRMPVYDGNLNNIRGIVYVKDLIYTLQDPKLIKLIDVLREAIVVPETKAVNALLREFQRSKMHMALVVDEFGDMAGIVTLEDVIEEIVGEIQDEYDYEPAQVERLKDGAYIFDGKTDLDRLKETFPDVELPDGPFETVAGLVFHLAGRVPKESDVLKSGELAFRVIKRDGRRLRKILVRHAPFESQRTDSSSDSASVQTEQTEEQVKG